MKNNIPTPECPVHGKTVTELQSPKLAALSGSTITYTTVEGIKFITHGHYRCLAKKESYSLKPFRNPSGQIVVQLDGYRQDLQAPTNESSASGSVTTPRKDGLRRVRVNFESLKVADAERSRLILEDRNSATSLHLVHTSLPESEVRNAEAAKLVLTVLPAKNWGNHSWTYVDAARFVSEHFQPCRRPKLLSEAIEEFNRLESESNLRFATLESKAASLNRLLKDCSPGIHVHEVPVEMLKRLIHSGSKRKTWKKTKSNLNTFFEWAAHEDQSYTPINPVKNIKLRKKVDDYRVPKILTNDEVFKILSLAQEFKGGRLFLFCVVGIVVALRPAEMARVQALRKVLGQASFCFGEAPDEQFVSVIGKTRRLRPAIIPPEFVPLIKAYVDAGYPIIPRNFAHDWTLLRAKAGFLGRRDLLPAHLFSDKLEPWTSDVLRHVGITHHLNRSQDETATALWAGDSPAMIFRHYKGKATREDTRRFYAIAEKLKTPTVEEFRLAGTPEQATDSELKRLKCPVDNPNTFFLDTKTFHQARKAYLARCPEAATPEIKGERRGKGMWTKRRMLDLPTRNELLKLFWTYPLEGLANRFKVTRATMALVAEDHKIPLPGVGRWQQRAAGKLIDNLPEEVVKAFPDGLPKYQGPVGRAARQMPSLADFFNLLWQYRLTDLAPRLNCSEATINRFIKRHRLSKPGHSYWHTKPEKRVIPERIKYLLSLDSEQLRMELAKCPATNFAPIEPLSPGTDMPIQLYN
jgi:site-specific recombinase XerD